jgi:hypothetical protein
MLRFVQEQPEHAAALDRVRAWTRERFALSDDATILVSEVSCALPGCPPRETVVAFWTENERRHQFKLFKPVAEVVMDDAADAPRHRRCGLPKIARMPTLASPNRVLHRGTPVKPSPGRAIAGWHVPAGLTITDVSRCFAKNRTTC